MKCEAIDVEKMLVDYLFKECKKDDEFLRAVCRKFVSCFCSDLLANLYDVSSFLGGV